MARDWPITASLLFVFGSFAFRNDLPIAYRSLLDWLTRALVVAIGCFYTGLAFRESFHKPYVHLLMAACIPLVMLTAVSTAVKVVERKLNRPVVLLVRGGEDRYISAALVAVFGLSAAVVGALMRYAP